MEVWGVLSGKVGTEIFAAQIGRLFGLSGLPMALFYLKIGLHDVGRVFAKCLIFDDFSPWFTYLGCQKVHASQNMRGKTF